MTLYDLQYRELIFDLLCGEYNFLDYPVKESELVKNEFYDGGECDTLYNEMTEAYDRLSLRLGIENQEDRDVEKIIGCLTSIGRHLALKMFEYGVILAQRDAGDS